MRSTFLNIVYMQRWASHHLDMQMKENLVVIGRQIFRVQERFIEATVGKENSYRDVASEDKM